MSLTPAQQEQVRTIAQLEVQTYFNHYLLNVFPKQMDEILDSHNSDVKAHGGIIRNKFMFVGLLVGAGFSGGVGAIHFLQKFLSLGV